VCPDRLIESALIISCGIKARVTVPFLRRFKANWATEAYLRRSLRNRKGYLKRMEAKRRAAGINTDITLDDGAGSDSEEGSSDEMDDDQGSAWIHVYGIQRNKAIVSFYWDISGADERV